MAPEQKEEEERGQVDVTCWCCVTPEGWSRENSVFICNRFKYIAGMPAWGKALHQTRKGHPSKPPASGLIWTSVSS